MAKAKFHSFRGEKSALIMVRANAFVFSGSPVYVPKSAIIDILGEEPEKGTEFDIPDGYKLQPLTDEEGNPRTTNPNENGEVSTLMCLVY